jgi:hypothetical protein
MYLISTFIALPLVHIYQKKKITPKIAAGNSKCKLSFHFLSKDVNLRPDLGAGVQVGHGTQ